jgi:hypothetical protein
MMEDCQEAWFSMSMTGGLLDEALTTKEINRLFLRRSCYLQLLVGDHGGVT